MKQGDSVLEFTFLESFQFYPTGAFGFSTVLV